MSRMPPKFLACLINWVPFTLTEMKREVWGIGENHEFGLRFAEFKLPLRHTKRKKISSCTWSSELGGPIYTGDINLSHQLYVGFIKIVRIEKIISREYRVRRR